ncbi:Transcription factor IIIB 50 kDa subunit, partial [Tauraco erythrolophus]
VVPGGLCGTLGSDAGCFSEVTYSQSTGQKEQRSRCLQRGIRRVQDLCKVLQLPMVFGETAVSYFQRAVQHPSFHLVSLEKKELLGGCCVFVTCRQHNWPLTMGTICSLLYASGQDAPEQVTGPLAAISESCVGQDGWKSCWNAAGAGGHKHTQREPCCYELLLSTLRQSQSLRKSIPVGVSQPCVLRGPAARLTCPFARFCKLAGIDLPPPAHLRLKELLDILLRMASQLAWLRVFNMDKKTVVKHIGDLLQHRISPCEDSSSSPPAAGEAAQEEVCPSGGKRQREGGPRPLLPPCLINPRKRLRTAALSASDSAITGDEPISDSEIEQYLRGPEEIQAFRKAK